MLKIVILGSLSAIPTSITYLNKYLGGECRTICQIVVTPVNLGHSSVSTNESAVFFKLTNESAVFFNWPIADLYLTPFVSMCEVRGWMFLFFGCFYRGLSAEVIDGDCQINQQPLCQIWYPVANRLSETFLHSEIKYFFVTNKIIFSLFKYFQDYSIKIFLLIDQIIYSCYLLPKYSIFFIDMVSPKISPIF